MQSKCKCMSESESDPPILINHCPHHLSLSLSTPSNIKTHHIHTSHYQNIINTSNLSLSATHSCTLNSLSLSLIIPMKPSQQQQLPKSFTVSSSPGRSEKLPAPGLARLLIGKSGSRSRSTRASASVPARSSPMFVSRTKSLNRSTALATASAAADGEPTSPKVTCIGQVRIRKLHNNINKHTNKKIAKDLRSAEHKTSWCLFDFKFRILPKRRKKRECCKFFCWRWKRHHHHRSNNNNNNNEMKKAEHETPPIAFVREMRVVESESEEEEEEEEGAEDEETKRFVSSSSAGATMHSLEETGPPKNALLLMRCRSAPHNRSSALSLYRFHVSPVPASESEEDEKEETAVTVSENNETATMTSTEVLMPTSSTTAKMIVPLSLMRCKSEPAKSGEKLMQVKWNGSGGGEVNDVGPTQSPSPILLLH